MKIDKLPMGTFNGRPIIIFPDGWAQGWANPEIEDGQIPLSTAEAYLAHISLPRGERHTFPFCKVSEMKTPKLWREWRALYYTGGAPCPFGYSGGAPLAPWGYSIIGVPKLHPEDGDL